MRLEKMIIEVVMKTIYSQKKAEKQFIVEDENCAEIWNAVEEFFKGMNLKEVESKFII